MFSADAAVAVERLVRIEGEAKWQVESNSLVYYIHCLRISYPVNTTTLLCATPYCSSSPSKL